MEIYNSAFVLYNSLTFPCIRQLTEGSCKMRFVYVIYNRTVNKIYIGETGDLKRRIGEHNSKRGNHFTARFDGDWELIYKEKAGNRQDALAREKQWKSFRGREFVKKLIVET